MATPISSGSAFHRRRSIRGYALGGSVTLQENERAGLTPAKPAPTPPSVLRARNGAATSRELFNTPRTPPARLSSRRSGRRTSRAVASPTRGFDEADVHTRRRVRAAAAAGAAGAAAVMGFGTVVRVLLRIPGATGVLALASRFAFTLASCAVPLLVLAGAQPVVGGAHPKVGRAWSARALRYVLLTRSRALHVALSAGMCAVHVLLIAGALGAMPSSSRALNALPAFVWAALCVGAVYSILAQSSGALSWRFSDTRDTAPSRARADAPYVVYHSLSAGAAGCTFAWTALFIARRALLMAGVLHPASSALTGSFGVRARAAGCAAVALLSWTAALAAHRIALTSPLSVRALVADALPLQLKAHQERSREVIEHLLGDLPPVSATSGIAELSQMLALQFFRDVARCSRAARRVIFSDASGVTWNALFVGCITPVDTLASRLAARAPARVVVQSAMSSRRSTSGGSADDGALGDARSAAWACETLSHMLVASLVEDDYGVAQRTFVHIVMALLALRQQLDTERERSRIMQAHDACARSSNATGARALLCALLHFVPPQDIYYADHVALRLVGDALDLALHRLVDAFRPHLKGYLVGGEPQWDRRFDHALKDVLDLEVAI